MVARSRTVTLYRLLNLAPSVDSLLGALDLEHLDIGTHGPRAVEVPGADAAVIVTGHYVKETADWCRDLAALVDRGVDLGDLKSAGLLLLSVDGTAYAIGFGQGFRLVPDQNKDRNFGLRFAIRTIDPQRVHSLIRRALGGPSRTDSTYAPAGLAIDAIGVSRYADLVNRVGGELGQADLALDNGRPTVRISGATGLELPIPLNGQDLIATIRRIEKILSGRPPRQGLEFIESLREICDPEAIEVLDLALEDLLSRPPEKNAGLLTPIVPAEFAASLPEVRSYEIRIGSVPLRGLSELDEGDFLRRAFVQPDGQRVQALHDGKVSLDDGTGSRGTSAIRWLETTVSYGSQIYTLMDGVWYEPGAGYYTEHRRNLEEILAVPSSLLLPSWPCDRPGHLIGEREYNQHVEDVCGRDKFLNLDRKGVQTELHRRNGFEAADLLGPDNTLIAVKRAWGSEQLGHQFWQALVTVQELFNSAEARRHFAELVECASGGTRTVPPDYRPEKVILAIKLKDGKPLGPETLFPFAQLALVNVVQTLRNQYDIAVEVLGI